MAVPTHHAGHLLRIADLDAGELRELLTLAALMKAEPERFAEALRGRTVVTLFEQPARRTRVSFAAAAWRLGINPLALHDEELQFGRGETIADTARALSRYAAALVARTYDQSVLEELAAHATVPVINALSDQHHPCQALADLLTLRERFGRLEGLRLTYAGDADNVAHSLLEAGALVGMRVTLACPPDYVPAPSIVARAEELAAEHGGHVAVTDDLQRAATGAHAVYTARWVALDGGHPQATLGDYRVTEAVMERAHPDAVFMHCLPAHRGQEVAAAVIDGPRSVVWEQAENRMYAEQALLYALISGDWAGHAAAEQ